MFAWVHKLSLNRGSSNFLVFNRCCLGTAEESESPPKVEKEEIKENPNPPEVPKSDLQQNPQDSSIMEPPEVSFTCLNFIACFEKEGKVASRRLR